MCYATGPVPRAVALPVFLSAKNGGHTHNPHVHLQRAKRVDLVFPSPTYPIQLDGEQVGAAEMSIEVLPSALSVLWPR
ncbi:TIGR00147: lipid kinase, YegS/Rv2252/BmrU family [Collinsella intestinalis]|nr:TIGR00147: lipid kinase, YegS/Rv2252/BmrU family [Collinsella intestinalis]